MNSRLPAGATLVLLGAIAVVGLNLRGPIVAVAPVLDDVQRELQVTETAAGLLTAVPVLCFAAVSPLVAVLARRIGSNATVAVGLLVLVLGLAVRPWGGFGLLLAGTVLVGAAITCGNVLLPVVARRDFTRPGPAMSVVTTALVVSAGIPAVLTVPLALHLGWRAALALWAVPAAVALGHWWLVTVRARASHPALEVVPVPARSVWRAPAAWQLGGFFGLQSLLFFTVTAWLPTMLQSDGGLDAATAGTALSLLQFLGLVGTVAVPMLVQAQPARYAAVAVIAALWVAFLGGLLLLPQLWAVWCVLGGIAQGGGLALGLGLIAARSSSGEAARSVSAMVQTVGYSLSATGPVLIGGITAVTAGWTVPFLTLMALAVLLGLIGLRSAAPHPIR